MFKLLVLFLICDSVISYSIPSYVHLCKRNDPKLSRCIINTVNTIKPYLKKGISEMNLPSIEPFHIENITFNDNKQTTVIDLELYNGIIENSSNFKISKLDMNLDKGTCTAETNFPSIKLTSKYKLKGKLMFFNLNGSGNLTFNLDNVTAYVNWQGSYNKKGGKRYLKFDRGNLKSTVGNMSMRIDDLFKNNPTLTDNFNEVINNNVDMLSKEFSPLIDKTINSLVMKYFNYVFDVFPIDVLFPRE